MKKFLASLVYTFVFMTFAVGAQAALIIPTYSWDYTLNIDFVNGDGSLSDTFTWQTTTGNMFPTTTTGEILGGDAPISGSYNHLLPLFNTLSPLDMNKDKAFGALDAQSGTARFAFDFYPNGDTGAAQTVTFDVEFSAYTTGTMNSSKLEIININYIDTILSYNGLDYYWGLELSEISLASSPIFTLSFGYEETPPTATPEPATMLLMGAGLASLGAMRRRASK